MSDGPAALRELLERREAVRAELRAILAAAGLSEAAQQRWDALMAEADALERNTACQVILDEFARQPSPAPP